jgi:hypothetical protein
MRGCGGREGEKKVGKAVLRRREFGMVFVHVVIVTLADVARPRSRIWGSTMSGVGYPQSAAAAVAHWLESLPASVKGTSWEVLG